MDTKAQAGWKIFKPVLAPAFSALLIATCRVWSPGLTGDSGG